MGGLMVGTSGGTNGGGQVQGLMLNTNGGANMGGTNGENKCRRTIMGGSIWGCAMYCEGNYLELEPP